MNLFRKVPDQVDGNEGTASDVELVHESPKRKKPEEAAEKRDVDEEIRTLKERILLKANAVLALTTFKSRIELEAVTVTEDKKKSEWYSASVKCPICNKTLHLAFSHRTTTSLANFKRHFKLVHIKKTTKPGVLSGATPDQPKISTIFKKTTTTESSCEKPSEQDGEHDDGDLLDLTTEATTDGGSHSTTDG